MAAAEEPVAAVGEESVAVDIVRRAHEAMAQAEASGDREALAAVRQELKQTVESLEPEQQAEVFRLMQQQLSKTG